MDFEWPDQVAAEDSHLGSHRDPVTQAFTPCSDKYNLPLDPDDPLCLQRSALWIAISELHQGMRPYNLARLTGALRKWERRGPIRCADVFSGTGISVLCHLCLAEYWWYKFSIRVDFTHSYSCESDATTARWSIAVHGLERCFKDVAGLTSTRAANWVTGVEDVVEHCDILSAGFICKDKSSFKANRSEFRDGIKLGFGQTGLSFMALEDTVTKNRPKALIVENLVTLRSKPPNSNTSEADVVVDRFKAIGFETRHQVDDASSRGSVPDRDRLWFHSCHGDSIATQEAVEYTKQFILDLPHVAPCYECYFGESFKDSESLAARCVAKAEDSPERDFKYKEIHQPAFREEGLQYPPDHSSIGGNWETFVSSLNNRAAEVSFYGEKTQAWPVEMCRPQWADVNLSLDWYLKAGGIVWRQQMPTMTCSSVIVMRVEVPDGSSSKRVWARLDGELCLRMLGFPMGVKFPPSKPTDSMTMAGNAFSGFSYVAQVMGLAAGWEG